MAFLGQVAAYIACGVTSRPTNRRDAPQHNILPFGWAGCPPRDLFAKKLSAKRPSGDIPPAGVPPVQRAGGTHFSKFSQLAPLFRILVFLNPFFEKTSIRSKAIRLNKTYTSNASSGLGTRIWARCIYRAS
jgi:hypothetical protein